MLFAFPKEKVGLLLIFYIIIYHRKGLFSSARVRVCEDFSRKMIKIAGKGLCRRFDAMFDSEYFSKETKTEEDAQFNFFDKMSRSRLDFSAFGGMLLHTPFLRA